METMGAWRICWKNETGSTNADARTGSPGDVLVADFQTAGRGRLDHRWLAPAGINLMFSAVLDVAGHEPADIATLPLVAGLAVVMALQPLLEKSSAKLTLKWPNDVLADGRKLAGILCELCDDRVVAGVGVNVNQTSFAPEIADRATSLALLSGKIFDRHEVLDKMLAALDGLHARWSKTGFAAIHPELAAIDHLSGRMVSVLQTDSDPMPVTGLCGGIQQDGTLLVGSTRIYAGEAHVCRSNSTT